MHSEARELKTFKSGSASRETMQSALSGLLTANDVAKELHASPSIIRGLINAGEIHPLGKVGQIWVFWRDDVEALKVKRDAWRKAKQDEHRN